MKKGMLIYLFIIVLIPQFVSSQVMTIHTQTGTNEFNLAEIDSITFTVSDTSTTPPDTSSYQYIPGHELLHDETWSGNLILKGDITIPYGITLTIQPGTIIKVVPADLDWDGGFSPGQVDIYSSGNIIANGTADNIIVITVNSNHPAMNDWWGIGFVSGSVNLNYCCIAYADYGLFVFSSSSTPVVENCMFAYGTSGIVDFGPDETLSHNTFINLNFGYDRFQESKTANLSYCVFENNALTDISTVDSYNEVTIDYSNFINNDWYNLYTSGENSGITANNCYGITTTNDNGCGNITINNPSPTPIADAGCGFELSELLVKMIPTKRTKGTQKDLKDAIELMKYYNEKSKQFIW